MAMLHIKGKHKCSSFVSNSLPIDLPDPRGMGSIGQKSTFSEQSHVAYQIKENDECSNIVANNLLAEPPTHTPHSPTLGMGSIGQN